MSLRSLAVLASLLCLTGPTAIASAEDPGPAGPFQRDFASALAYALVFPNASPQGANDWSCKPSAQHPYPVVLVHGTFENAYDDFAQMAPTLKNAGYCVFAPNLGGYQGTAFRELTDIAASAVELSTFIDRVLAATGAPEVDIVGHSQGGMMPRYYFKYLGGAAKVHKLIALTPSNYGTNLFVLGQLIASFPGANQALTLVCTACTQQLVGSQFLTDLNSGGDTVPGVEYTVIATAFDEVVTPFWNTFLRDPRVTNVLLQQVCPLDATDHLGVTYDPITIRLVLNQLDPSTAQQPLCIPVPPVIG
jgi:triacylglycerol esterase/lipase EstA (alpha/beta hydrolase family)